MKKMEFDVQIGKPPQQVFAYLSDLEKHSEWSHCSKISKTSEGPVGVGTTYASTGKNFGMTTNETVEIITHQPNERFAWRTAGAMGMKFVWEFEMRPSDGGTLLVERLDPPTGLAASIIGLLAEGRARKAIPEGLTRIKEKLEQG